MVSPIVHRRRPKLGAPIAMLVVLGCAGVGAPGDAAAQIAPELRCQEVLAKSARAYVTTVHRVRAQCENLMLAGKTCDAPQDTAKIANAAAKLEEQLALRCQDSYLPGLGFPGQCDDGDGPPFTVDDLAACIRDTHDARVDEMITVEYLHPSVLPDRATAHCGEHIGRSVGLSDRHVRARQRCLNLQNRGDLSGAVDCLAAGQPFATGDAKTDKALAAGSRWSVNNLLLPCQNKTFEDLGFPGNCADPNGSPFTLDELNACMEDTHAALAIEMVEIQYALAP